MLTARAWTSPRRWKTGSVSSRRMRSASSKLPRASSTSAIGNRTGPGVAEAVVNRQHLLAADAQRLLEIAACLEHVGNMICGGSTLALRTKGDEARVSTAEEALGLGHLTLSHEMVAAAEIERGILYLVVIGARAVLLRACPGRVR
jgi:hypothetical protein